MSNKATDTLLRYRAINILLDGIIKVTSIDLISYLHSDIVFD
jgi:hypothetical protein